MLRLTLILPVLLAACVPFQRSNTTLLRSTKTIRLYDGSTLQVPRNFTLTEEVGDNPIVVGSIRDALTTFEITSQTGAVLGVPYDPANIGTRMKAGDSILNHYRGTAHGLRYQLVIARGSSGQQTIYISFPAAFTNFSAHVSSADDIRRFKQIVLTFQPKRPNAPNHALQRTALAVTLAASCLRLSPTMQPARQPPPSLSLGSLGASPFLP